MDPDVGPLVGSPVKHASQQFRSPVILHNSLPDPRSNIRIPGVTNPVESTLDATFRGAAGLLLALAIWVMVMKTAAACVFHTDTARCAGYGARLWGGSDVEHRC